MAFKDLRLGAKFGFGFGLVLLTTASVAGVGLLGMASVDDRVDKAADVQRLVDLLNDARQQEKNFILRDDPKAAAQAKDDIASLIEQAKTTRQKFQDPKNQQQMDRVAALAKEYTESFGGYVKAQASGADAEKAMIEAARTVESVASALGDDQLAEYREQRKNGETSGELDMSVKNAVDSERVVTAILQARRHEKNFQIRKDPKYVEQVNAALADGEEVAKAIGERETTEKHKQSAQKLLKGLGDYKRAFDQFAASLNERKALEQALVESARALKSEAVAAAADQVAKRSTEMSRARRTMLGGLALALLFGGLAALLSTRAITSALGKAVKAAHRIASGDLTGDIGVDSKDEIGELLAALSQMKQRLSEIVGEVRSASIEITGAADAIATGNEDLARRTTEQVASLEETAASMEELTTTVKQNTENAARADHLATEARQQAELGSQVLKRAMDAMGELSKSSNRIADIIGLIDEIAFQTNVLALNAAVEAARAGEEGRGFAVVAAEVRQLAQRSAAAAREISVLIRDSLSRVEEDTRLVNESGQSLHDILGAVTKVTDVVGSIAEASRGQTGGIEQATSAMSEIDQIAQQNSVLVESAADAARALDAQAHSLEQLMSQFKVSSRTTSTLSAPEPLTSLVPQPA